MTTRKLYQYRILFADDQPEVARTLAGLFRTTEIKVDFAVDGQEALVMCQRTRYDLVIVDLQMPPERWGGLWFIRKLSERMYRVPVLVLSGAAGQAETIEALHLKAKGFVVKDRAQYELREKVTAMLAEGRSEVRTLAMQTLPTPIAVQCSRMDSADSPVQRLYLTLSALEYALRVTCIIAVAEARMDGGADAQKFLYDVSPYIIAPAMGTSNAARRMAASMLPGSMGAGLASQFDDRLTNEAIAIRNEIAHVQMPSEVAAREYLVVVDAALDTYLAAAVLMPRPEIAVVNGLSFDGTGYSVSATLLRGDHTALPQRTLEARSAVISQRAYLWHETPIDLWPYLVVETRRELGSLEICIFDGMSSSGGQGAWHDADPLRYIKVREGQRIKSSQVSAKDTGLIPHA